MRTFLKDNLYPLLFFLVALILGIANYKSGAYLSGWDNLQTDLSPWLGIKRSFFAVWQEYQGLGLLGGLAHSSDLIRAIFTWLLSFILPQSFIRFFYHILMLFLGGVGMYMLCKNLGFNEKKRPLAFLGGLFYMLNLGTVQIFYVPFEAFSHFFAALPWELWIFGKLLTDKNGWNKRNLLLFFVINLLATPQAYVQTLFVVYLLVLLCLGFGMVIESKSFNTLRRGVWLILLIVLMNAFWILPQVYFLKTSENVVAEAKINQISTDDVFYQNLEKGTPDHFMKLEGFYFDLFRTQKEPLFLEWKNHFDNPLVQIITYAIFGIIFLGLFSRRRTHASYVFVFLLIVLALLPATFPFSYLNDLIRTNEFIDIIFRSPFTKFVIPYSLVASYLFISGLYLLSQILPSIRLQRAVFVFILVALFVYSYPAFRGYFFSPSMWVNIPDEYFSVMKYFETQDKNKRIALLPDYTYWGWFYNRWGYNGSGFLWYGIEQPIISRTFDVWSSTSERYFWEIKTAIEKEDRNAFENVIEKYNVDFFILDKSLLSVNATFKDLQYERLGAILSKSNKVRLVKDGEFLSIYKVEHKELVKNFVSLATTLSAVGPQVITETNDVGYNTVGSYRSSSSLPTLYYPFRDFTNQTRIPGRKWSIREVDDSFVVEAKLDVNGQDYQVSTPSATYEMALSTPRGIVKHTTKAQVELHDSKLQVVVQKVPVQKFDVTKTSVFNCSWIRGRSEVMRTLTDLDVTTDEGTTVCFGYKGSYLEQRYGYLVKLQIQNLKGRELFFYIQDNTKKQAYLEGRIRNSDRYFLISPRYQYGLGYNFNFQANSYENMSSENVLSQLEVYAFPYDFVNNIVLTKKTETPKKAVYRNDFEAKKVNYYTYEVRIPQNTTNAGYVILYQAFDPGWKAYQDGKELEEHTLVNNWANGWLIPATRNTQHATIQFVFWPQYLEYIGFGLLIGSFLFILLKRAENKEKNSRRV